MYIVQCKYSEAGEKPFWKDLNKWFDLENAKQDLKECRYMYRKSKTYKWRIIEREVKIFEKVVKL